MPILNWGVHNFCPSTFFVVDVLIAVGDYVDDNAGPVETLLLLLSSLPSASTERGPGRCGDARDLWSSGVNTPSRAVFPAMRPVYPSRRLSRVGDSELNEEAGRNKRTDLALSFVREASGLSVSNAERS